MRHVSEVLVPGFGRHALLCRGRMPRARGMAVYLRDGYGAFRQHKFGYGCCEILVFMVCDVRQNLYVFSLYRNPDLDDRIFNCLLHKWLLYRLRKWVPLSCLWVIWMAIISSFWVLQTQIVMVLQPLTLLILPILVSQRWRVFWSLYQLSVAIIWCLIPGITLDSSIYLSYFINVSTCKFSSKLRSISKMWNGKRFISECIISLFLYLMKWQWMNPSKLVYV